MRCLFLKIWVDTHVYSNMKLAYTQYLVYVMFQLEREYILHIVEVVEPDV